MLLVCLLLSRMRAYLLSALSIALFSLRAHKVVGSERQEVRAGGGTGGAAISSVLVSNPARINAAIITATQISFNTAPDRYPSINKKVWSITSTAVVSPAPIFPQLSSSTLEPIG